MVASTTHWFLTIATNSILQNMLSMSASVYVCITVGSASANDAHICHVAKSDTTTTTTNMHTAQLNWEKERGTLIKQKNPIQS